MRKLAALRTSNRSLFVITVILAILLLSRFSSGSQISLATPQSSGDNAQPKIIAPHINSPKSNFPSNTEESSPACSNCVGTSDPNLYTTPSIVQPAYNYPSSQLVMINNYLNLAAGQSLPPVVEGTTTIYAQRNFLNYGSILWIAVVMPVTSSLGCFQYSNDYSSTSPCTTATNTWVYNPGTPDLSAQNQSPTGSNAYGATPIAQFDGGLSSGGSIECSIPYGYTGQAIATITGSANVDSGCNQTYSEGGITWDLASQNYNAQTLGSLCNNYAVPKTLPSQVAFGEGNTLASGQYQIVTCWFEGPANLYDCQNYYSLGSNVCDSYNPDIPTETYEDFQVEPFVTTQLVVSGGLNYGEPGSKVSVEGQGFAPDSDVAISFGGTYETSAQADSFGAFNDAAFTIPANQAPGSYVVSANDSLNNVVNSPFQVLGATSLSLSISQGPAGTSVYAQGVGFTPNSFVILDFGGQVLPIVPDTDSAGSFVQSFIVPNSQTGPQTVTAKDPFGLNASATFTVTTEDITFNPSTMVPGGNTIMTGTGFVPSFDYLICINDPSNNNCVSGSSYLVVTDNTGSFSLNVAIPDDTSSYSEAGNLIFSVYQSWENSHLVVYVGFPIATYSATFQEKGIPSSGVTWGVTVDGADYTGSGTSIVVSGLSGTVNYSYDTPVTGISGSEYVCPSGCSGTVSGDSTVWASYQTLESGTLSPVSTVSQYVPLSAIASSPERKVFFADNYWWVFWDDYGTFTYSSSPDGSTWSTAVQPAGFQSETSFSVSVSGDTVNYAASNGITNPDGVTGSFYYDTGTLNPDGTIGWGTESTVQTQYPTQGSISITTDTLGNPWVVAYTVDSSGNQYAEVYVLSSGTWSLSNTIEGGIEEPINGWVQVVPIPELDGASNVAVLYSFEDNEYFSGTNITWTDGFSDGSWSWTNYTPNVGIYEETEVNYAEFSATAIGDVVYIAGSAADGGVYFSSYTIGETALSSPPVMLSSGSSWYTASPTDVSISQGPSGTLAVFYNYPEQNVGYSLSTDLGETWSQTFIFSNPQTEINYVSSVDTASPNGAIGVVFASYEGTFSLDFATVSLVLPAQIIFTGDPAGYFEVTGPGGQIACDSSGTIVNTFPSATCTFESLTNTETVTIMNPSVGRYEITANGGSESGTITMYDSSGNELAISSFDVTSSSSEYVDVGSGSLSVSVSGVGVGVPEFQGTIIIIMSIIAVLLLSLNYVKTARKIN